MANFQLSLETKVSIPEIVNDDGVTYYSIGIQVDSVEWDVKRRYSDFAALHEKLVDEGVDRDVLPPKKLLGNKDPAFLMKRRKELETYLQNIFHFLACNLPTPLAEFLDFDKYDINFILKKLAGDFYQREVDLTSVSDEALEVETVTQAHAMEKWTPLEMYSVSQRLQHTCPPSDPESKRYDFTNVVDACCRMHDLGLIGSCDSLGSSSIKVNQLKYDFLAFKNLSRLTMTNVCFDGEHITSLGILRSTLKELTVHNSDVQAIVDVLLCDTPHSTSDPSIPATPSLTWTSLISLDLSENKLKGLDRSIRLAPSLETLVLNKNSISKIEHLTGLPRLRRLALSQNKISLDQDLHTVMGQVTQIDLSHNIISSLAPFKKLYSLQNLNMSHNKLKELEDVYDVCALPCLETINLSQNKINHQVDYRLKILESIGTRCREVVLDGSPASQAELDKVSVLMALRVTREKKCPTSLFGNLPNSEQWKN